MKNIDIIKVCEVCGSEFTRPKGRANASWEKRRFCSKPCVTKHRWRTTGFKRERTSIEFRFWKFVDRISSGCWRWNGAKDSDGYGQLSMGKNMSPVRAHRLSWLMHFGAIPESLDVCHACDNPSCVNPDHLMLGTRKANMVDASKKGRVRRGQDSPSAKLTNIIVRDIRERRANGEKYLEIASMYHVSRSTIMDADKFKTWEHVK